MMVRIKPELTAGSQVVEQTLNYYGHVMRAEGGVEKYLMPEKVNGNRKRGKQGQDVYTAVCCKRGERNHHWVNGENI